MQLRYAIVVVSDMTRSVAFYRDVVGLPLRLESAGWTEFITGTATLALHCVVGADALPDPAPPLTAGRCRAGFSVPSLADFHDRMIRHGVTCLEEPAEVFGVRIAQYADPDGLPFSVSEKPARPG